MKGKSRLAGHAQQMFLEHYAIRRYVSSDLPLLRVMFSSKSGRLAVREYFHNMTLSQLRSGGFSFTAERSDAYFKSIQLNDNLALNVLEFLRPQIVKVSLVEDIDVKSLEKIMPYVETATKLDLDHVDAAVVPFVQHVAPKICELTSQIEALTLPGFPLMNLQKFRLLNSMFNESANFAPLLQHKIKEVDLTDVFNPTVFGRADFGPNKNSAIECLHIKITNTMPCDSVLPFVQNLSKCAPNFQTLNLTIDATSSYLDGTRLSNQLIEFYNDVVSFKDQTQSFLKKLFVRFSGDTFVVEGDDYEIKWADTLQNNQNCKNAKFTKFHEDSEEVVEIVDYQSDGTSVFSFTFKAVLATLNEVERQQWIEDNFDDLGMDSDEDDVDYDNSDGGGVNYDYSDFDDM